MSLLLSQILKGIKYRNQLINERADIDRKISVLTNCINTLRFIQGLKDKHRMAFLAGGENGRNKSRTKSNN